MNRYRNKKKAEPIERLENEFPAHELWNRFWPETTKVQPPPPAQPQAIPVVLKAPKGWILVPEPPEEKENVPETPKEK